MLVVTTPDVSLVIPVYNGAPFLGESLARATAYLDSLDLETELVAVDDGSTDETPQILAETPGVLAVRHPVNRGKYAALKSGMLRAEGRCRVFTDADIPYDLEAILHMHDLLDRGGFHIAVGDRTLSESETGVDQTIIRRLGTRAFSFAVRMLVTGELFDTQAGLKGFRGDVAAAIFPLVTDDGFAGDVELLYVALKYNLAIRRIPVRLLRAGRSTVSLTGHSLPMLRCIAGLRRRWRSGAYESAVLRDIASQRYWEGSNRAL